MLLKNDAERAALLAELAQLAPAPAITGAAGELIERVRGSANDANFPGAVIVGSHSGRLTFYAAAESGADWRELAPLLMASVGVTTTNFTGRANEGSDDDPIIQALRARGMFAVSHFEAYGDLKREQNALQALARLRTLLQKATALPHSLPRSTSQALYDFHAALAGRDHDGAEGILAFLREGMRIDALNRSFLEVRLDEAFGDWNRLVARDSFEALCVTRRPPAVTTAMVEALYHTAIGPAEQANDAQAAFVTFRRDVLDRSGTLFAICPPEPRPAVGKAFLLATLTAEKPDFALIERLDTAAQFWPEDEARFFHRLRALAPTSAVSQPEVAVAASPVLGQFDFEAQLATARDDQSPPTLERAQAILMAAMALQSLEAYQITLAYVARLDATSREHLLANRFMRRAWEDMSHYSAVGGRVPRDWRDWIELLPSMTPSQAAAWASAAAQEHPIGEQLRSPEDVAALVSALNNPPIEAQERLFEALPALVEWAQADYRWPNQAYVTLYKQLFDLILLSSNRSESLYKALSAMLTGILEVGLDHNQYRATLADFGDTLPQLSGARDIDWLCDIAELTIRYPCPDAEGRARFWQQLVTVIEPYKARITSAQRSVLEEIAGILGLSDTLVMLPPAPVTPPPTARTVFDHFVVGVYTLTDGVGERVARILGEEYPGIDVRVNHDAVSTPQLRELAKRADIFVICWLSAKHAATGSINQERPADRISIYAPGKGSSSICREIRKYLDARAAAA
jgi:hypothetical protein